MNQHQYQLHFKNTIVRANSIEEVIKERNLHFTHRKLQLTRLLSITENRYPTILAFLILQYHIKVFRSASDLRYILHTKKRSLESPEES